jgi:hypothetical protein
MKRKYEEIETYTSIKRKLPSSFVELRSVKIARKNPMIRFIAAFRGYLARKLYRFKVYPFYQ